QVHHLADVRLIAHAYRGLARLLELVVVQDTGVGDEGGPDLAAERREGVRARAGANRYAGERDLLVLEVEALREPDTQLLDAGGRIDQSRRDPDGHLVRIVD